jgi:hypothetical protein
MARSRRVGLVGDFVAFATGADALADGSGGGAIWRCSNAPAGNACKVKETKIEAPTPRTRGTLTCCRLHHTRFG